MLPDESAEGFQQTVSKIPTAQRGPINSAFGHVEKSKSASETLEQIVDD